MGTQASAIVAAWISAAAVVAVSAEEEVVVSAAAAAADSVAAAVVVSEAAVAEVVEEVCHRVAARRSRSKTIGSTDMGGHRRPLLNSALESSLFSNYLKAF